MNAKRAILNSTDENIHPFALATELPEEIRKDAVISS
jgi:hypothetical protein